MDLIELLQREIHDLKMQWSKLKEENVVLRGFKAMVMQEPRKYHKPGPGHNGPPDDGEEQDDPTVFDVARDDFKKELNWKEKYDKEHKLRLEAEGETHLVKAVGMNSPEMKSAKSEVEALKQQLHTDREKYKKENNDLYNRIAELSEVEESHRKMNGKLQERLTEVEEDNKKLSMQVEDKIDKMRRSGM